jgi:hypothetical protein
MMGKYSSMMRNDHTDARIMGVVRNRIRVAVYMG